MFCPGFHFGDIPFQLSPTNIISFANRKTSDIHVVHKTNAMPKANMWCKMIVKDNISLPCSCRHPSYRPVTWIFKVRYTNNFTKN